MLRRTVSQGPKYRTKTSFSEIIQEKPQPQIKITKKDSLEVIEIVNDSSEAELRAKLTSNGTFEEGKDDSEEDSKSTTLTDLEENIFDDSISAADTKLTRLSQRVDSWKIPADAIHFPVPNGTALEAFEEVYLHCAQLFDTASLVASPGDPLVSRMFAFLSASCFDLDVVLRYTLEIHPVQRTASSSVNTKQPHTEEADEDGFDDEISQVTSVKQTGTQPIKRSNSSRVVLVGSCGRVCDKINAMAEETMPSPRDEIYKKKLYIIGNYSRNSGNIQNSYAGLSKGFSRLGELCADFANKLYSKTGFFNIHSTSIPISKISFIEDDALDYETCLHRLNRKSFLDFITDAETSFSKALSIYSVILKFWETSIKTKKYIGLNFNDFEMSLSSLEKVGNSELNFFSPKIERFINFRNSKYVLATGVVNLEIFWDEFKMYPNLATLPPSKLQRLSEQKAFKKKYSEGISLNRTELLSRAKAKGKVSGVKKTRKFAKRIKKGP